MAFFIKYCNSLVHYVFGFGWLQDVLNGEGCKLTNAIKYDNSWVCEFVTIQSIVEIKS